MERERIRDRRNESYPARQDDDEPIRDKTQANKGTVDETEANPDIDKLLDEIDELLETNTEEFVRNFQQRGGE